MVSTLSKSSRSGTLGVSSRRAKVERVGNRGHSQKPSNERSSANGDRSTQLLHRGLADDVLMEDVGL